MAVVIPIKIKKLHPKAVIPQYMTPGAACMDLVATEIEYIDEHKVVVKYGFATEIPQGFKAIVTPRSSFTHRGWIMANSPGIVDSDFRGEWVSKHEAIPINFVEQILYKDGTLANGVGMQYLDFPYKVGDRVVQVSFEITPQAILTEVNELSETKRGEGGFGSTNDRGYVNI